MKLTVAFLIALSAWAQNGTPVRVTDAPTPEAWQSIPVISGTNTVAVCYALSNSTDTRRANIRVAISAISKASAAVVTSVGHGFDLNGLPQVTISGATGTGWVSGTNTVNGTFVATPIDADTFSIPVNTTGNGTLAGTIVFTTTAPRKTVFEWAVKVIKYDGSNNAVWIGWLGGTASANQRCTDYASSTISRQ